MDTETENVFDKVPKRSVWDFPQVDLERFYEDDDGKGGDGVHTHSTIFIKLLPQQEAELIVILEEWLGQRL